MPAVGTIFPTRNLIFIPPAPESRSRRLADAGNRNHVSGENLDRHTPTSSVSAGLRNARVRNDPTSDTLDLHAITSVDRPCRSLRPQSAQPDLWMLAAGTTLPVMHPIFMILPSSSRSRGLVDACRRNHVPGENLNRHPLTSSPSADLRDARCRNDRSSDNLDLHVITSLRVDQPAAR